MAEIGVHLVGEVERRGSTREVHDLALRAERVNAILEDFRLQAVEQVRLQPRACARLEQLPQPVDLLLEAGLGAATFLVLPVRSDAEFGVVVHLAGADLHLERQAAWPDDGRVQRTVVVLLRRRDVVVEFSREIRPEAVHDAERGVAFGDGFDLDPHCEHVHDLLEGERLALHLPVDAEDVLRASADLTVDARLLEFAAEQVLDVLDVTLAFCALRLEPTCNPLVLLGFDVSKGQVFEFPLHLPDAESIREWRVDLAGFERRPSLFGGRCLFQVSQAHELQCEPEQYQPYVRGQRQQQLADAFRLLRLHRLAGVPVCRHPDTHNALDLSGQPHGRGAEVVLGTGVVERAFLQPGDQQPSEQQVLVHPERGKQCTKFEAVGRGVCGRERLQQLEGGADAGRLGLWFEFGGLHSVRYHTPLS